MFRRRWVRRAIAGSLVAIAVAVAAFFLDRSLTRRAGEKRYEAIVAHLDATDPRWRYDEIYEDQTTLADAENGALLVPKFRAALAPPRFEQDSRLGSEFAKNVLPNHVLDDDIYETIDAALRDNEKALAIALSFADYPKGSRKYTLAPNPFNTLLPDVQDTRIVFYLLDLAAERSGRDGRGGAALRYVQPMMNAGRSVAGEPFMISALVRMAIDKLIVRRVERTLGLANPRGRLAETQDTLLQEAESDLFWYSLRGDRAMLDTLFTRLATGELAIDDLSKSGNGSSASSDPRFAADFGRWRYGPYFAHDHATFLELTARAYEARLLPEHEQRSALEAIVRDIRNLPPGEFSSLITRSLTPAFNKIHDANLRIKAQLRCAATGIAVEQFRLDHGRWPDSLDEIPKSVLAAVPRDPFGGEPLKYIKRDDGVTVYAIGFDGQDNGGTIKDGGPPYEPGQDFGIRLYNPERRGLPAAPHSPAHDAVFLGPDGLLEPTDDPLIELAPEPREVGDQP